RSRRAPSRDSAARRCAAAVASAGTGPPPEGGTAGREASGSREQDSREAAALRARPRVFEALRFEQLEELLPRRAFVPLTVAADEFEQGVGGSIAVARCHLGRSELKP